MGLRDAPAFGRVEGQAHPSALACLPDARRVDASGRAQQHQADRCWDGLPVLRQERRNEQQYQALNRAQPAERPVGSSSPQPLRLDAWQAVLVRQGESSLGLPAVA